MISQNKKQCELAADYFYEMASPETIYKVPENIRYHISNCPYCSEEVAGILRFTSESQIFRMSRAVFMARITAEAKRHFAFVGALVDCRTVKGFLPLLADPELKITIPTPITVHLNECDQCSRDFSILCRLNLGPEPLAILAEVYSKGGVENLSECSDFHDSIELVAGMYFDQVAPDALEHVRLCRDCRRLLYDARQRMIEETSGSAGPDHLACEKFDISHFFYCCVPCDRRQGEDRQAVTDYFRASPACLEKIQQLHSTLYGIAERPASGAVTCYELAPLLDKAGVPKKLVDCKTIRRFLPVFVADELELVIPGPLTAHLQDCPQCKQDFETLRSLNLNSWQLFRLRSIFAAKKGMVDCKEAQRFITSFAAMDFAKIDPEISRHLCACTKCRELIYREREKIIDESSSGESASGEPPCEIVKPADLFNYCFPFGTDPLEAPFEPFNPEVALHIPGCPECLVKIQKLHKIISGIAGRGNSGVLTGNELPVPSKKEGFSDLGSLYAGWPIKVWIRQESRPTKTR